ncbi:MAG TPA: polymer-forming cytoskeletal protein [Stellaceae bacterium]|nr:polymer-forming cytoskeletal protein [Stellaceae bacterium]
MFRRKKTELEDEKPIMETNDELGLSGKPASRPGMGMSSGKAPVLPTQPPRPTDTVRPGIEMPRPTPTQAAAPATPTRRSETEHRKLIVGREIALSGEITSCDRLVVEGSVEANLANCRDIDIAESGLFKGSASIEEAEIRGRFEGTLTVRKKLLIRSTGKVIGTVRYAQIEIEAGGQLAGDIQVMAANEPASGVTASAPAPAAVNFEPLRS